MDNQIIQENERAIPGLKELRQIAMDENMPEKKRIWATCAYCATALNLAENRRSKHGR